MIIRLNYQNHEKKIKYFYFTFYGVVLAMSVELSIPMVILPMSPIGVDELFMDIDMLYCASTAELKIQLLLLPEWNLLLKH